MRKNVYAIIDTETAGSIGSPLFYDCAVIIFDRNGNEYIRCNWLLREVWDNSELFNSAYYAWKRPLYSGIDCKIVNSVEFAYEFTSLLRHFGVTHLLAYNLAFDLRSIENTTNHFLFGSVFGDYTRLDVWGMACELLFNTKKFRSVADLNGWKSEKGNYKTSAEIAYRFITNNYSFDENHTALKDCEIEKEIFLACLQKKKKFTGGIISNPWRIVQKKTL